MSNLPNEKWDLGAKLLKQEDSISGTEYKEYRMKLEDALTKAERNEKWCTRLGTIAIVVAFVLMFVGGSKIVGPFDPTDKNANVLSVTLLVIYVAAAWSFILSILFYFTRFRPRVKQARDNIRDARGSRYSTRTW